VSVITGASPEGFDKQILAKSWQSEDACQNHGHKTEKQSRLHFNPFFFEVYSQPSTFCFFPFLYHPLSLEFLIASLPPPFFSPFLTLFNSGQPPAGLEPAGGLKHGDLNPILKQKRPSLLPKGAKREPKISSSSCVDLLKVAQPLQPQFYFTPL